MIYTVTQLKLYRAAQFEHCTILTFNPLLEQFPGIE